MAAKLSDRELRLQALKLSNAYDQPHLVQRPLRDTDRLVDITNVYDHENWPDEKVYCSRCDGHHHRMGFTALVIAEEGVKRMLLGSHCGADAFGQSWRIAEKRMNDQCDRQYELRRLDRLEPIFTPFISALSTWRKPVTRAIGRLSAFSSLHGELYSRLREAYSSHGGMLTATRITKLRDGTDHAAIEPVAALPGAAVFDHFNCVAVLERASDYISAIARQFGKTDQVSLKIMKARRREFEDTFSDLERVAKFYAGAQEFFTPKTFELIAHWVTKFGITKTNYQFTGDGIRGGYKPRYVLPRPFEDLDDSVLDLIHEYQRAD
jgi:hypothetical protein